MISLITFHSSCSLLIATDILIAKKRLISHVSLNHLNFTDYFLVDQLDPSDLEIENLLSNRILPKSEFIFSTKVVKSNDNCVFVENDISEFEQPISKTKEISSAAPA